MHQMRLLPAGLLLAAVSACQQAPPGGEPSPGFVGSGACATCHESEFDRWQASHHALAMQPATEAAVLGDFDNSRFVYFDETIEFTHQNGAFSVSALDSNGERQNWTVSHAFGIEPLQQYLVETSDGRKQALPVAWDTRPATMGGQRWFHLYADEYVGPADPLHWTGPYQNWNFMCAECHSTNLVTGYDYESDRFDTSFAEVSVGCEACHGPGSAHIAQADRDAFDDTFGLRLTLDDLGEAVWTFESGSSIATRRPAAGMTLTASLGLFRRPFRRGPACRDAAS